MLCEMAIAALYESVPAIVSVVTVAEPKSAGEAIGAAAAGKARFEPIRTAIPSEVVSRRATERPTNRAPR
jgi:hypothetical protein